MAIYDLYKKGYGYSDPSLHVTTLIPVQSARTRSVDGSQEDIKNSLGQFEILRTQISG